MKVHDALILELIKPTRRGEPTGDIIRIVGSKKIKYNLEETEVKERRAISRKTDKQLMYACNFG